RGGGGAGDGGWWADYTIFFAIDGRGRDCNCYTGAMRSKYNIDELRAGARNFGVGVAVIGIISLMFGREPLTSLFAIAVGVWFLFKASEKRSAS
ncbi:MAG: hypothetical protein OD918_07105, partial [Gammaproteobacteria bacterium]